MVRGIRTYSITPRGSKAWESVEEEIPWGILYYLGHDGSLTREQLLSRLESERAVGDASIVFSGEGVSDPMSKANFDKWFRYVKRSKWVRPSK